MFVEDFCSSYFMTVPYFGTSGKGEKAVTGRAAALYDIQNDIVLDAKLAPFSHGERVQALEMLEKKHIF